MIRHGMAAGSVVLMMAAAAAAAAPQDVLTFGKGKPAPPGDVAIGRNIVNGVCWACHGRDLNGGTAPPLTGRAFYKEWGGRPADELSDFIRNRMPKDDPGALSDRGAHGVVAYIVTYANKPESLAGEQKGK